MNEKSELGKTIESSEKASLRAWDFLGMIWMIIVVAICTSTDLLQPQKKIASDFISSFYVAGYLVFNGQVSALYPPLDSHTFIQAAFDKATHELLQTLPEKMIGIYMYSPFLAVVFALLAFFSPAIALLLFQLISILALLFSAIFLSRNNLHRIRFFSACFAFLPVVSTLWIGQLGILFGLVPFAFAYVCFAQRQYLACGFMLSLLFLKPQLFPSAVFVALAVALQLNWKPLAGLSLGTLILCAASFCFGTDIFLRWLHSFAISETLLSSATMRSPSYLAAGLPGAILNQLPPEAVPAIKPIVYSCAGLIAVVVLCLLHKIAKSKLNDKHKFLFFLGVSIFCLPLYSPRLLLYDLSMWILPLYLLWELKQLRGLLLTAYVFINVYVVLILIVNPLNLSPLLLSGSIVLFAVCFCARTLQTIRK